MVACYIFHAKYIVQTNISQPVLTDTFYLVYSTPWNIYQTPCRQSQYQKYKPAFIYIEIHFSFPFYTSNMAIGISGQPLQLITVWGVGLTKVQSVMIWTRDLHRQSTPLAVKNAAPKFAHLYIKLIPLYQKQIELKLWKDCV